MRVFSYHDNLERLGLADDAVELPKLGILILHEKNRAVEGCGLGRNKYSFIHLQFCQTA